MNVTEAWERFAAKLDDWTRTEKLAFYVGWSYAIKEAEKLAEIAKGYPTSISAEIHTLAVSKETLDVL